ncbi:hypothetical protein MmiEs2_05230 [Methanimicrococcus stummii]|uniref:Uncharacterized protein n=2 Tax=Methanimicrococcus stummii TaxID=3028294 RepID=A0AA96VAM3_9EURY|nr:hypothetical protein MmiEs2_05230 [Methanimicrococcus sp. Es2]
MYYEIDGAEGNYKNLKEIFSKIFKEKGIPHNGILTLRFDENLFVDKIEEKGNILYGRFGRLKENHSIQARNKVTMEVGDIFDKEAAKEKGVEIFSYFLIDFETGIICSVSSSGAPSLGIVCKVVEEMGEEYHCDIVRIIIAKEDVLKRLYSSNSIYSIKYELPMPSPELADLVNIPQKDIQRGQATLIGEFKNEPRIPLLENVDMRKYLPKLLKTADEKKFKQLEIRAKQTDGCVESFDLFEQFSRQKIKIEDVAGREAYKNELYPSMLKAYKERKNELKLYSDRHEFK